MAKRRHGCMYNSPMNDFNGAEETQNIVPRPMSMQSQLSQQHGAGGIREQVEPLHPAQPSLDHSDFPQDFAKLEDDSPVVHMRQFGALDVPSVSMSMGVDPTKRLSHTSNGVFYPPAELHPFQNAPRPLPSQGLFRMLHSNSEGHAHPFSTATEPSSPPDLYSSLNETPDDPPEEDMHPSDPDLVPHEQDLRFTGDLYTPRWVRGHGNKREGWCGLCKPGRWLVLKNSAFWYDKSFTHGVSAATGAAFQGPQETRRTEGNADVWEGHCGSCGDWISLVSSKKKGTTWFRHAYKCHTHPKVKDGPKRRRETPASMRARAASNASATTTTTTATSASPASRLRSDYQSDESPVSESEKQAQLDAEIRAHLQVQTQQQLHSHHTQQQQHHHQPHHLQQQHQQFAPQQQQQRQRIPLQLQTGNPLDSFAGMI
ncbi:MAG: hypothetical protein Q9157_005839 [Trypethelium eluteriae]